MVILKVEVEMNLVSSFKCLETLSVRCSFAGGDEKESGRGTKNTRCNEDDVSCQKRKLRCGEKVVVSTMTYRAVTWGMRIDERHK